MTPAAFQAFAAEKMYNPDGSRMSREQMQETRRVEAPIVVELFTTSDCSACVLADRLLYDAMKDKNVIALSCHVKDMSGSLETGVVDKRNDNAVKQTDGPVDPCIFRQWTYKVGNSRQDVAISIPEFIINGYSKMGVSSMELFYNAINQYHYAPQNETSEIFMQWKDKDTLTINLPQSDRKRPEQLSASIWLVKYKEMAVEKMNTGVNQGKVLRFSNIVQETRHIAKWRGETRSIDLDVARPLGGKERGGYVVLVQETMGSKILAAGKLEDYPMPNDIKRSSEAATEKPITIQNKPVEVKP